MVTPLKVPPWNGKLKAVTTAIFATESIVKDGLTAISLNTSTVQGDTYTVKARIKKLGADGVDMGDACSWTKSGEIQVIAGRPHTFSFITTKNQYHSDGTDTSEITAEIKDQYGNLVEDGTVVTWGVDQSPTPPFDSMEETTTAGIAKAVLRARLYRKIKSSPAMRATNSPPSRLPSSASLERSPAIWPWTSAGHSRPHSQSMRLRRTEHPFTGRLQTGKLPDNPRVPTVLPRHCSMRPMVAWVK